MKPTPERILDAAEDLFAERGYAATSLGDVAGRVGIRSGVGFMEASRLCYATPIIAIAVPPMCAIMCQFSPPVEHHATEYQPISDPQGEPHHD